MFCFPLLEFFQFGEAFVSNAWAVEQLSPRESELKKETTESSHDTSSPQDFIPSSEEDSSITVTSSRASEHPSTISKEPSRKPPIGNRFND